MALHVRACQTCAANSTWQLRSLLQRGPVTKATTYTHICTKAPRTHAMCVSTALRVRAPLFELQKPAVICKCLKRAVKVVNARP